MTIQLELDLQFKTSYIFDLLDLLHECAKFNSKLSRLDKYKNRPYLCSLSRQVFDLLDYAISLDMINSDHINLVREAVFSSHRLFWSV